MFASFFNSSNNWFGYIANFFFAGAGLGTVARWIYKLVTRHNDDKLKELEDKLNEQTADIDDKFELVLSQYRPNGGSSVKDQLNKLEKLIENLSTSQEVIHQRIDSIKEDFAEHKGYHQGLIDAE
jgi:vacuolar-type H+-ATPase subunit I/STV1